MEAWVFGASGMLGTEVKRVLEDRGHGVVFAPDHWDFPINMEWRFNETLERRLPPCKPDVVINCAGAIPSSLLGFREWFLTNALGPYNLRAIGARLIHMSTDCVFSGDAGKRTMAGKFYSSADNPDPIDLYGRTKLVGEVDAPHVLNVRGSFIGLKHGFLRWVLDYEDAAIPAWQKAYWNGTSVKRMAAHLVDLAEGDRTGIVHVAASEPVTKAWMIGHILKRMEKPTNVVLQDEPYLNLALWPDIETVPVEQALDELIEEVRSK